MLHILGGGEMLKLGKLIFMYYGPGKHWWLSRLWWGPVKMHPSHWLKWGFALGPLTVAVER